MTTDMSRKNSGAWWISYLWGL